MKYVDSHCHIEEPIFDKDRDQIMDECNKKEIVIINCSGKPDSNQKALKLAKKYKNLKISLGMYPVEVSEMSDADFFKELKIIEENKEHIVGIGEVGLDHYWIKEDEKRYLQAERFKEIVWLANKLKLPLNVHSRDAEKQVIAILYQSSHVPVVLHAYGGPIELAIEAAKHGFYFSIPPNVVYNIKRQKLVDALPVQNILTETDSPYLGPTKERNDPRNIPMAVEKIAEIKNMDLEETRKIIIENTKKVFNI